MSLGVSRERYEIIISRYEKFVETLDKLDKEPVKVFDKLTKKQMDELELIRDVSKYLQTKKDDDIKNQNQAPAESTEGEKEAATEEEKTEEKEKKEN